MNAPAAVLMQRKDAEPPSGVLLDALPLLLAQALEYSDAVRVVRDVDDYLLNFNRLGGWDGWARHLGAGTTVFGAPTYVALVLLERSMVEGRPSEGVMSSGQVAAVIGQLQSCSEVIGGIVAGAEQRLQALHRLGNPA